MISDIARRAILPIGKAGEMRQNGVRDILTRRAAEAGIDARVYPHLFRHSAASSWLLAGGQETDAMKLFGWRSRRMLERYGAAAAQERAIEAHRRLSPGDRI
jgi:integrase